MSILTNRKNFTQNLLLLLGVGASIKSKRIFTSKPANNLKIKDEKMNSTKKRKLSVPCGLDCFKCEIYEENITEEMKKQFAAKIHKDPEEIPCKGEEIGILFPM